MATNQTIALAYSREDEMQADQIGLSYLTAAGYGGAGLLTALKKIRSKQNLTNIRINPTQRINITTHRSITKHRLTLTTKIITNPTSHRRTNQHPIFSWICIPLNVFDFITTS